MYSSDDSEFDYETKEKEIGLYTLLYFGTDTNPELKPQLNADKSCDSALSQKTTEELKQGGNELNNIQTSTTSLECNESEETAAKSLKRPVASTKNQCKNMSKKRRLNEEGKCKILDGPVQGMTRKRNASICSLDSISGKEPLDNLYSFMSDDLDLGIIPESDGENDFSKSNVSYSDNEEESRCNMILNQKKKNSEQTRTHNSAEEEVTILPPPRPNKPKPILETLDSSSDESIKIVDCVKKKVTTKPAKLKVDKVKKTRTNLDEDPCIILLSDNEQILKSRNYIKTTGVPLIMNVRSNLGSPFTSTSPKSSNKKKGFTKSQVLFTKGKALSKRQPSCPKWTPEMTTFYDSDNSDDFSVKDIHHNQSDSVRKWQICHEDRQFLKRSTRRRYFEDRCSRCRQFGHTVKDCSRLPHCLFCASTNHIFINQCPENCCLKCGEKPHGYCQLTQNQKCSICFSYGHHYSLCPDLWRRYHATTTGSVPVVPDYDQSTNRKPPYCYNCAQKGHYGHECRLNNATKYVPLSTLVVSYSNPYKEVDGRSPVFNRLGEKSSAPTVSATPKQEVMQSLSLSRTQLKIVIGRNKSNLDKIMTQTDTQITFSFGRKNSITVYGQSKKVRNAFKFVSKFLHGRGHLIDLRELGTPRPYTLSPKMQAEISREQKRKNILQNEKSPRFDGVNGKTIPNSFEAEKKGAAQPLSKRQPTEVKANSLAFIEHPIKIKEANIVAKFPAFLPLGRKQAINAIAKLLNPIPKWKSKNRSRVNRTKLLYQKVINYFNLNDNCNNIGNTGEAEFYFHLLSTLVCRKSKIFNSSASELKKCKHIIEKSKKNFVDPALHREASSFYTLIKAPPYEALQKMITEVKKQFRVLLGS